MHCETLDPITAVSPDVSRAVWLQVTVECWAFASPRVGNKGEARPAASCTTADMAVAVCAGVKLLSALLRHNNAE
jgi:hypothetical protein